MFKDRYKFWAIFMAICIAAQLVVHVVGPLAVNGITSWWEDYQQKHEQMEQEQATAPSEPVTEEEEATSELLSKMVKILSNTARYVGVLIVVYGVFNVVLAFTQDDAERISRGVITLVVGAALTGLSALAPHLFSTSKTTETDETANTIEVEQNDNIIGEGN
ncbi:MAG: hypothetical protein IJ419_12180 [Agathobacter sp.]|nr:hypothetical protein [Agathobacter sp.]